MSDQIELSPNTKHSNLCGFAETLYENNLQSQASVNIRKNEPLILVQYKNTFIDSTEQLFGHTLDNFSQTEVYPVLNELFSLLSSIDQNKGIYYSQTDVMSIYNAVSDHIFTDPDFRDKLNIISQTHDQDKQYKISRLLKERTRQVISLEEDKVIGLVKKANKWQVVNKDDLNQSQDKIEHVLEWIRQDNDDKTGPGRYRVRETTYTPRKDDLHNIKTVSGLYRSNWYTEPNYWSRELRNLVKRISLDISQKALKIEADMIFVSEGGVFKGTVTEGTDIDTFCFVVSQSKSDFQYLYELISNSFKTEKSKLPFSIKKDEQLRPVFFDRSTGQTYFRNDEGEYDIVTINSFKIRENIPFEIRENELGLYIVKNGHEVIFPKPSKFKNTRAYATIDSKNLQIEVFEQPTNPPDDTDTFSQQVW